MNQKSLTGLEYPAPPLGSDRTPLAALSSREVKYPVSVESWLGRKGEAEMLSPRG
jgi:hypothetical protein